MQIIPLQALPNQTVLVQLGNQSCTITVQQQAYGMFLTLFLGNNTVPTIASALCENLNRLVRDAYLGFVGDLLFNDTQGSSNPVYTGLGGSTARYQLCYVTPTDLAAFGLAA